MAIHDELDDAMKKIERLKAQIKRLKKRIAKSGEIDALRKYNIVILKHAVELSEAQNYCKICGETLDGYVPDKAKGE